MNNKVYWQRERIERDREMWGVLFAFDSVQYHLCKVDIKILQLHKKHDFKNGSLVFPSLFVSPSYRVNDNMKVKTINKFWTKNHVIIQWGKRIKSFIFLRIKCLQSFNLGLKKDLINWDWSTTIKTLDFSIFEFIAYINHLYYLS